MIINFKRIKKLMICGALGGLFAACNQVSNEAAGSSISAANTRLEQPSVQTLNARLDLTERRVNELMQTVRLRREKLARWERENVNISPAAKLEAQRLKDDLKRVKKDLDTSLHSIQSLTEDNVYQVEKELSARLARTQDELAQIQEELREWYDSNN